MPRKINNIAIIGTGLIGASWAAFYASKGFGVKLYDADNSASQKGYEKACENLLFFKEHESLSVDDFERAKSGLKIAASLAEAFKDVELVQESVAERYEIKQEVFQQIDLYTSTDVIVASSSSGLLITEIQKCMKHPQRSMIAHPFNPPHLIPLVELVPGKKTNPDLIDFMADFFEKLGKTPVILKKEIPGHIANRLQAAVWREAIQLVIDGVASLEDVDKAVCAGPGLRWALMGPHMIFHLGGGQGGIGYLVDHIGVSFEILWKNMAKWDSLPAETKGLLVAGIKEQMHGREIKDIATWRDEKLLGLLEVIRS